MPRAIAQCRRRPTPIGRLRILAGPVGTAGLLAVLGLAVWGAAAGAAGSTVQVGTTAAYGPVLEDASGLPLYTLATDQGGQSSCTGSCLQVWPPLTVPAGQSPTAGPGVPGTLATAVQSDGRTQVTYGGAPLYTFLGDSPGQVTGQGESGFTVVQVAPVSSTTTTTTAAAPAPTTTTTVGPPPPASGGVAPTTAAATTGTSHGSPAGSLAFTGPGPWLPVAAVAGLVLLVAGAAGLAAGGAGATRRVGPGSPPGDGGR